MTTVFMHHSPLTCVFVATLVHRAPFESEASLTQQSPNIDIYFKQQAIFLDETILFPKAVDFMLRNIT
jgi:hypothetical protein